MYKQQIARINQVINAGPFVDNWESLANYQIPQWYQHAKFGIFSHFGPYTVPEFGHDWYVHGMYTDGDFINEHHKKTYGPITEYGYKYLVDIFKAEHFDAHAWIDLIKKSGARYYVPVAEHHDGFQMYESSISSWNSKHMGPKIDIIKELKEAAESQDIEFGVSTHRAEHWFFLSPGLECESDVHNSEYGDLYWPTKPKQEIGVDSILTKQYLEDWLVRTIEIIDKFKPRVLYFDFWIENPVFKPYTKKILAYYYNVMLKTYGDCGVVNYKHDGIAYGCAVRDMERGQFAEIQRDYWQACTSSTHGSWIYTKANEFKCSVDIIRTLIDIVSKNGNLLLNIGPKADGSICPEEQAILTDIGEWLEVNGEAIFNTHPWKVFGEGNANVKSGDFTEGTVVEYQCSDIRFTSRANIIYAMIMNPENKQSVFIKNFGLEKSELKKNNVIKHIEVLGGDDISSFERQDEQLSINFNRKMGIKPIVIKLELE
ncbi:alpha-L-fucosidase [Mollicutes bacterium LVI A0039]|nr:alpha-L-fucosidase [Mollicutes bacterium LVI A0039]